MAALTKKRGPRRRRTQNRAELQDARIELELARRGRTWGQNNEELRKVVFRHQHGSPAWKRLPTLVNALDDLREAKRQLAKRRKHAS